MIYTNIKHTFLLALGLFFFPKIPAQTLEDLTPKQRLKLEEKWSKWTHTGKITLKDSSSMIGQAIYPTDSGIVWRNVPQYVPYADTNVQLLYYRDINTLQINCSSKLGRHITNGGLWGGTLMASATYYFWHSSWFDNRNFGNWVKEPSLGILGGMATGLLTGLIIDGIRKRQIIHNPNRKSMRKSIFTQKLLYKWGKKGDWRKYWVKNDSLIQDYFLPPELDKLRPYWYNRRLQIKSSIGISTRNRVPRYSTTRGEYHTFEEYYYVNPSFVDLRATYQIKPQLKIGVLTIATKTDASYLRLYHNDINPAHSGTFRVKYRRTYGLFTEYTPFPVDYLAFRRWELNVGLGILREVGDVDQSLDLDYFHPDNLYENANVSRKDQFTKISVMTYLGLSIHLSRNFSLETQLGHYFIPKTQAGNIYLDLKEPLEDISIVPQKIKLSRSYLSFGASIRL